MQCCVVKTDTLTYTDAFLYCLFNSNCLSEINRKTSKRDLNLFPSQIYWMQQIICKIIKIGYSNSFHLFHGKFRYKRFDIEGNSEHDIDALFIFIRDSEKLLISRVSIPLSPAHFCLTCAWCSQYHKANKLSACLLPIDSSFFRSFIFLIRTSNIRFDLTL